MSDNKKTYVDEARDAIRKWGIRLIKLKEESINAKPEHRAELEALIEKIKSDKAFIEEKVSELEKADNGWRQVRESIEGAVRNLDDAYRSALVYSM